MKPSNIGGQAVMEGIMMRHKDKYSIAVRRPDHEIELKVEDYKCTFGKAGFLKWPIIRGVVSFVDGLVVGTKCLMYSAEIAGDEEDEKEAEKNAKLTEEELEGQHPDRLTNIAKSRKEIEDTLDTLNMAFAKLFDNLYQDTSMDITADISVLHTLLAQEGLTGEEIKDAMKDVK